MHMCVYKTGRYKRKIVLRTTIFFNGFYQPVFYKYFTEKYLSAFDIHHISLQRKIHKSIFLLLTFIGKNLKEKKSNRIERGLLISKILITQRLIIIVNILVKGNLIIFTYTSKIFNIQRQPVFYHYCFPIFFYDPGF